MVQMFVNPPVKVITQGVSRIHAEFSKKNYAEYFKESLEEKDSLWAVLKIKDRCIIPSVRERHPRTHQKDAVINARR